MKSFQVVLCLRLGQGRCQGGAEEAVEQKHIFSYAQAFPPLPLWLHRTHDGMPRPDSIEAMVALDLPRFNFDDTHAPHEHSTRMG
jgi:hypothetical protein